MVNQGDVSASQIIWEFSWGILQQSQRSMRVRLQQKRRAREEKVEETPDENDELTEELKGSRRQRETFEFVGEAPESPDAHFGSTILKLTKRSGF